MGIWVRSQDKRQLINANKVYQGSNQEESMDTKLLTICAVVGNSEILLGEYSTEEKALKVMDMIQERIAVNFANEMLKELGAKTNDNITSDMVFKCGELAVFQMPADDEVEL